MERAIQVAVIGYGESLTLYRLHDERCDLSGRECLLERGQCIGRFERVPCCPEFDRARRSELNADQEALASNIPDHLIVGCNLSKCGKQTRPLTRGVLHEPFGLHDVESCQSRRYGKVIGGERQVMDGRSLHTIKHSVKDPFAREYGRDGHMATRQRLGE